MVEQAGLKAPDLIAHAETQQRMRWELCVY